MKYLISCLILLFSISVYAVNVKESPYNAAGDGVTNDLPAIEAAIYDQISTGTVNLYFPPGIYKIDGPIIISGDGYSDNNQFYFSMTGAGKELVTITTSDNTQDMLYIERGNGNTAGGGWIWGQVRDLTFKAYNGLSGDSGAAIRHRRGFNILFENLNIFGANYSIVSEGSAQCHYQNIFTRATGRASGQDAQIVYTFTSNGEINRSFGNYMSNIEHQAGQQTGIGLLLEGVDGLYMTNGHLNFIDEPIVNHPKGTPYKERVLSVKINNFYFDGDIRAGNKVRIRADNGGMLNRIEKITLTNSEFRSGNYGVVASALSGSYTIKDIVITGNVFTQLDKALVALNNSNVDGLVITGNTFSDGLPARTSPNSSGIRIGGSNTSITGNTVSGNWKEPSDGGVNVVVITGSAQGVAVSGNVFNTDRANNVGVNGSASDIIVSGNVGAADVIQ